MPAAIATGDAASPIASAQNPLVSSTLSSSRVAQKTAPPTCKYKTMGILTLRQRSAAGRPEAALAGRTRQTMKCA